MKVDLTFAIGGIKNHEIYFEHLGGSGGDPTGAIGGLIERDFGSTEAWRADLKATGIAGRGWAWTAYDWDERRLFNYIGDAQNTFPVWNATPLVALDVYEHAYFLDYQTDRGAYIDAFFANLDWDVVNGWVDAYQIPTADCKPTVRPSSLPRMFAPLIVLGGYLLGSAPFGYWVVRVLARRGRPHAGQRQHRRDKRLAGLRPPARCPGDPARCRQGLRAGARGAEGVG